MLALAGAPSSGKTTVAATVAESTGARRIGFGDYVRAQAVARGQGPTRDVLQHLGQQLLNDLGPEGFCRAALRHEEASATDRPIVWDGVRHVAVAQALTVVYGAGVHLVYLDPPREDRRSRFAKEAASADQLARWERDATEVDGAALAAAAELISTAADPEQAAAEVLELLGNPPTAA